MTRGSKAIFCKTSTRSRKHTRSSPPPSPPSSQLKKLIPQLISTLSTSLTASNSFLDLNYANLLPSQTIYLQSLISSINNLLSSLSSSPPLPLPPPPSSWFHRFLSHPRQDPTLWLHSFNMSKKSFHLLLSTLLPHLHTSLLSSTPPIYALASSLFRLTHASPYRYTATLFSTDVDDSCSSFYIVCKCIMENLRLFSDRDGIFSGFQRISLPNCCGVLGMRSFPLKGEGLVKALMVVDCEKRFVDVSVGWPSSMKTDLIIGNCMLSSQVESTGGYVLGDSCFPLLPWLLTPFPGGEEGLPLPHHRFNEVHRVGMEIAEMAVERVCSQWGILSMEWKEDCRDLLPYVVVTCCLLHNFLIENEELTSMQL